MQRRGVARLRGPRLFPSGVSVSVFSSGESQTGFHRESLQITSILARRKQNLHPTGSTPLFLPLLSLSISFPSPPSSFPLSPLPPTLSGVSVYSNQRPHLHARKGKKHLWLREEEKKEREREEKKTCLIVENDTSRSQAGFESRIYCFLNCHQGGFFLPASSSEGTSTKGNSSPSNGL